jgi:hypothetical protein
MTVIATERPTEAPDDAAAPTVRRRGIVFWVTRYLPAEIVGTAAMVIAGLGVTVWTGNAALIALAALLGETLGFYAVLAVTIYIEQRPLSATRRRALARTGMLLIAEFGVAELLDTLLIRPAALVAGVWLFADPLWGLLAGKIVADIAFYVIAAGAFTITARTGLREGRSREGRQTVPYRRSPASPSPGTM